MICHPIRVQLEVDEQVVFDVDVKKGGTSLMYFWHK